ncbi:hypothetical protein GIB67_034617 [Kingdonia uniflora]|uniref:Uncharacterized protein n=1 Tax=Kingdonia uniflora TaxID=39325 RepID=A0A7J7MXK7_9MAGN|nr:hypothetical protein GIB67_034617 [Kingdonia uniflora]
MSTIENLTKTPSKDEEEEACLYAMQLDNFSVSAIELDVLEIIAKARPGVHINPSEIAFKLHTNKNLNTHLMLDRMLCLLASYKVRTLEDGRVEKVLYIRVVSRTTQLSLKCKLWRSST